MGVVERIDGADVAPVRPVAFRRAGDVIEGEVVDSSLTLADEVGDDVPAHVVLGIEPFGVDVEGIHQRVGIENVVAHGGQELGGISGQARSCGGLLHKCGDLLRVLLVHLDHTELVGHVQRLAHGGHSCLGAAENVLLHHLGEVHAVHVVRTNHNYDVGVGVMDQVQGLVDGVGAAEEPALADALLRRYGRHIVAQLRGHPPGLGNMAVKAVGLVLGQDHDLQVARIHQVGQRKVDQPVTAGKRHSRFRPVCRQWH